MARDRAVRLGRRLTEWYEREGRDLPWRRTEDPYRILVSEAMLQQTTVQTVVPYYERFLKRFPSVHSLARAAEEDVLALWSGLGYYRRARNLRAAAEVVVERHGGKVPAETDQLRELPGVGRYVAAAMGSMAFDRPTPPVDANIRRVGARLFALEGAGLDSMVEESLRPIFEVGRPRVLANALMDLGATVCTPKAPSCPRCPWRRLCAGRKDPQRYAAPPPRAPTRRRAAACLAWISGQNVWLVARTTRVMNGLWDLPAAEGERPDEARSRLTEMLTPLARAHLAEAEPSFAITHTIMSVRYTREVFVRRGRGRPIAEARAFPLDPDASLALTGAARKCLRRLV